MIAEPAAPGCLDIEGPIFYQNADGKLAHRLLTRLEANGNEK